MNIPFRSGLAALFVSAAAAGVLAAPVAEPRAAPVFRSGDVADLILRQWPTATSAAARAMIAEYGQPDAIGVDSLVWLDRGPWKRTVVHRAHSSRGPSGRGDFIEQAVAYRVRVPLRRVVRAAPPDASVRVDAMRGELIARSADERLNFLALNAADEAARGLKSAAEARAFAARTARLWRAGKSSRYVEGLQFKPLDERETSP